MLQIIEGTSVDGEVAVYIPPVPPAAGTWSIEKTPLTCKVYQNGLRQRLNGDYTVTGNILTSPTWQPADTILVDYTY